MIYLYRNTKVFYKFIRRKSDVTNVYLHGWGANYKSLYFCDKRLKSQSALFIDFPPFGESGKNPKNWNIFTYSNMVISLCQHLNLQKFNLFGHSFGGRVAIIMSVLCKQEVNKLILIDSAGLKPRRNFMFYFRVFCYKIRKKLKLDVSKYGSCDYLALTEEMREVFKSVVNTHLDDFLPFIKAQTLIIFGKNDKTTPIYMAKKFKKRIKNSKMVLLEDAGHFCFVDRKLEFLSQLENFV